MPQPARSRQPADELDILHQRDGRKAAQRFEHQARVELGATSLVVGTEVPRTRKPPKRLDLLAYGTPTALPFDPLGAY